MTTNVTLRNTIITLLFATLIVPLVVSGSLFFPYITGKGFLFRTLVEIAFALYVILAIRDKSYIPKKSVILWSLLGLLGVMAISTFISENPTKSFWSNYERMEGYITFLHLAVYFVVLAGVFTRNTWTSFWNSSLAASVVIGGYAFMGDRYAEIPLQRIQGTFGNSTYLGVYALIHIFIAAYLALRIIERKGGFKKNIGSVALYTGFALFNLFIMYSTGTRGSFAGLLVGALLSTILIAIFEKGRPQMRKVAVGICIAVVAAIVLLGATKNTSFVQKSPLLSRFGALITTDVGSVIQNQGHARSLIWGIAIEGFKDRPVFGWGFESFNYVFAKHYNPEMYAQEQWFDRSHNVFFDWLIAGGALGLLSYLSLFAAIIYLIWKKPEHSDEEWTVAEKAVLTGLLAAYFVHNFFVFDNLTSYLLFFALLAYVHERSTSHGEHKHHGALISSDLGQNIAYCIVAIAAIWVLYVNVYAAYAQNTSLLNALRANAGIDVNGKALSGADKATKTLQHFKQSLVGNMIGKTEVRERLAEIGPSIVTDASNSRETIVGYEELVQSEFKKQLTDTPNDPRPYMFYGTYLLQTSRTDAAIEAFKKTVELSPEKQSFLVQLGVAYFEKKDYAKALESLKQAYEIQKQNKDVAIVYASILAYTKQTATLNALLDEVNQNKLDIIADGRFLQALYDTKNFALLVKIAKEKIEKTPNDAQTRLSAAAIFMKAGDRQAAVREIRKAIELAPEFKAQGEEYIKIIQAGGDPSQ